MKIQKKIFFGGGWVGGGGRVSGWGGGGSGCWGGLDVNEEFLKIKKKKIF